MIIVFCVLDVLLVGVEFLEIIFFLGVVLGVLVFVIMMGCLVVGF